MENKIIKNLYQIVDSFLTEAKDQHGNDRTLERLNADRHLAVENLNKLFLSEIQNIIQLSDDIENSHSHTEFDEWRAFKQFRNTLRDKYLK